MSVPSYFESGSSRYGERTPPRTLPFTSTEKLDTGPTVAVLIHGARGGVVPRSTTRRGSPAPPARSNAAGTSSPGGRTTAPSRRVSRRRSRTGGTGPSGRHCRHAGPTPALALEYAGVVNPWTSPWLSTSTMGDVPFPIGRISNVGRNPLPGSSGSSCYRRGPSPDSRRRDIRRRACAPADSWRWRR